MTVLAGGVGGARMARALRSVLDPGLVTVIVNVGDNTERYGVYVAADPDTVLYTLAGVNGPQGWGRSADTTIVMEHLADIGADTTFTLGDADLAVCLARTSMLRDGVPLSRVTAFLADSFGVDSSILPATDDHLATVVQTATGRWLEFQEYFVDRGHTDPVTAVAYDGATSAAPGPGVIDAIGSADTLVIAPSNPPLSIWPILAIDEIERAVRSHPNTAAVSPLFGGAPLKGPADTVMRGIGLSDGTLGVLEAYHGLIDRLYVDASDAGDADLGAAFGVRVLPTDTRLAGEAGVDLARRIIEGDSP